jgi:microcystin degradation protein MlrC
MAAPDKAFLGCVRQAVGNGIEEFAIGGVECAGDDGLGVFIALGGKYGPAGSEPYRAKFKVAKLGDGRMRGDEQLETAAARERPEVPGEDGIMRRTGS